MIRTTSRLAAPALGLLAALAVAAPAGAGTTGTGTGPTPDTVSAEIGAAVTGSPQTAGVPTGSFTVEDVRTAASAPDWAAAEITPTAENADQLDPATVVLHQVDGTWTVVSLGTASVGCDETTPAVRTDLALLC